MQAANDTHYENTLELDLLPGQSMRIDLDEPAAAGYLWRLLTPPGGGVQVSLNRPEVDVREPQANVVPLVVGGASKVHLHIQAPADATAVSARAELVLEQPWRPQAPAKRLVLALRVLPLS